MCGERRGGKVRLPGRPFRGPACRFALIVCASGATLAHAQVAPDAGRIEEQLRVPEPPRVAPAPRIRIEPPKTPAAKDTPPFYVSRFRVAGATAFPEAELLALLGEPKRNLTLAQVQALAERVTEFYRSRGYIVARAVIPPQDVRNGVVQIVVVEGRYGRIDIANASEISETRLRAALAEVKEGALVHGPTLERAVLLIADWAGIQPRATLEPGDETGLTNLVLEIAPGRPAEYDLILDNAGSRFTGRARLSAGATLNSPFDIGDRMSLRAITSGERLFSARLAYEAPLGARGLRGIGYLSQTIYELGEDFAALDASGSAQALGGALVYPLVRSSLWNLRLQAGAEARDLRDRLAALAIDNRKTAGVALFGASADARDAFFGGGLTSWQLLASRGELSLHGDSLEAADAATARTAGGYAKLAYNLTRLQALTQSLRLSVALSGQWAYNNLDSSEKFSVGGLTGVRAYPPGEAAGDEVRLMQAELRYDAGALAGGQLVPLVFADWARSRLNHRTWAGFSGPNERRLAGYGFGAEWSVTGAYFVRGWYARKSGDEPATADRDRKDRLWMQAGILF